MENSIVQISAAQPASPRDATAGGGPASAPFILLNPNDDVWVALRPIAAGTFLNEGVRVQTDIPAGHKVARRALKSGDPVRRYNEIIGVASADIRPGDHVHLQNLMAASDGQAGPDYAFCTNARPTDYFAHPCSFMGIRCANGKVARRNYIGVLSSVNCSATAAKLIARHFEGKLAAYPNIDGVVALTHKSGCGMDGPVEGMKSFRRAMHGYVEHPNFAHVIVVGLGCEIANVSDVLAGSPGDAMSIQTCGGTSALVNDAIKRIEAVLPVANQVMREPIPLSELKPGMKCGGSSGVSGISCNPSLGYAADLPVRHGGIAILSETTECYGAEHILTARAATREVGQKLVDRIHWWEEFAHARGLVINNNPSPGNHAGGLTTIIEKSLGSIDKGGTTNLNEVYQYAEPVAAGKGLVFMDAPALDPFNVTAQVAGGAQVKVTLKSP